MEHWAATLYVCPLLPAITIVRIDPSLPSALLSRDMGMELQTELRQKKKGFQVGAKKTLGSEGRDFFFQFSPPLQLLRCTVWLIRWILEVYGSSILCYGGRHLDSEQCIAVRPPTPEQCIMGEVLISTPFTLSTFPLFQL